MSLTKVERGFKFLSGVLGVPLAPLCTLSVQQNYSLVVTRFGKIDRVIEPGLRWLPPFWQGHNIFRGIQTQKFSNLNILDRVGTPLVVSCNMNFQIKNPVDYVINIKSTVDEEHNTIQYSDKVIFNLSENCIRQGVSKKIFISDTEPDIRKDIDNISQDIREDINKQVSQFGVEVLSLKITEANYAPEIMNQMLVKQQSMAYIEGRAELVKGSIGIIEDTVKNMPDLSRETKEKIIVNLLTTLTSQTATQPVIKM